MDIQESASDFTPGKSRCSSSYSYTLSRKVKFQPLLMAMFLRLDLREVAEVKAKEIEIKTQIPRVKPKSNKPKK